MEKKKRHLKNILSALIEGNILGAVDGGTLSASASNAAGYITAKNRRTPFFDWASGSPIPISYISEIGEKLRKERTKKALFLAPNPYSIENIECFENYDIKYLTYDDVIQELEEKGDRILELKNAIEHDKNEYIQLGAYSRADFYAKLIAKVDSAKDTNSKKKTLEDLVIVFAQDLHLKDVKRNIRTPSSEIDVMAKNRRVVGIWKDLGTTIIFEAKNWETPVSADQIRNFLGKAKPAKTRFLIAWNGITGKDEEKSARLEIVKAKERGTFVLVLAKEDFEKIAAGIHPKKIVENKYDSLILDKIE